MADKLPYLQVYVADWIRDTRMLSLEARAIWFDLLTLMHDSDRRGYLYNRTGKPFSHEQLALYCATSCETVTEAIRELIDSGVASCTESGVLYSRRIVKDEQKRQAARQAGKKGGNPALKKPSTGPPDEVKGALNGTLKGEDKRPLNIDSSIRSSSGVGGAGEGGALGAPNFRQKGRASDALDPDFDRFWNAYPKKVAKLDACLAWDNLNPTPELIQTIILAVEKQKKTEQWLKKIIPNASTWLERKRWTDVVEVPSAEPMETLEEKQARLQREREEEEKTEQLRHDPKLKAKVQEIIQKTAKGTRPQ